MKVVFHCWDYNDILWHMLDNDLYVIEEIVYDDEYDLSLAGTVEYFVYLN